LKFGKNLKKFYNERVNIEAQVGGLENELEQVMQTCGYKLRETAQIANRPIQVYEKSPNREYIVATKKHSLGILEECIADLSEELDKRLVLIDGFDKDHSGRRKWIELLEQKDPDGLEAYVGLNKQNKLRLNRVNNISLVLSFLKNNIKAQEPLLQFNRLYQALQNFMKSKKYVELSLTEKVLYMEEIDRIVKEILDLLKRHEQDESFLK